MAQLKRQRELLTQLEASLAKRQQERDEAIAAEKAAFAGSRRKRRPWFGALEVASFPVRWNTEGEVAAVIASIRETIQAFRQSLAERVGRQMAERQALADLLKRFDAQGADLRAAAIGLGTRTIRRLDPGRRVQVKATFAVRFRRMSASFKEPQVQIRSEAATKLSADTIALHRRLAERDEFEKLTIDPAHYAMQVVPRDLGEEVPAGLYEGGGHRLLLGLAFRLAVARLVDPCPFLLLDEPTDGLDAAHREALLARIGSPDLAKQILLVTHQANENTAGYRVQVVRQDKETVVKELAGLCKRKRRIIGRKSTCRVSTASSIGPISSTVLSSTAFF